MLERSNHNKDHREDRNVEEYIYISVLPRGETIEEIYQSIKEWSTIPELKDIKKELAESKHKEVKDTILEISESEGLTAHSNSIKIRFEEE